MDTAPVTPDIAPPRFRLIWVTLLICLIGLAATWILVQTDNSRTAGEEALLSSGALAESASLLLKPLVINEDRISINYLLNEMTSQPVIRGMRLSDTEGTILGLSGEQQGESIKVALIRNDESLGTLEVWADSSSLLLLLQRQQFLVAIGASATLLTLLLALWLASAPRRLHSDESDDSLPATDFDTELAKAYPGESDDDSLPILDPDDLDNLDLPPVQPLEAMVPAPPPSVPEQPKPAPQPVQRPQLVAERDKPAGTDTVSLHLSARDEELDDSELVSLLKPERDTTPMPRFTPATAGRTREPEFIDDEPWVELEERQPEPAAPALSRHNPLLTALDDDEEQLNLYAFEQDLELMLPANEAGYLLLIDTTSAHSELVEEEEHQSLLKTYRMLANSVAVIYNGRVIKAGNGDLQIIFDQPQEDDTHGVNAMCAAMLFTHLYKQYNHSRVRLFRPVMNLHMALVRGKADKLERLLEEARFLTRTTQSNELISHTALTEAPQLKGTLLEGASIRREDEDKVLILQISQSYQALLEKQSRHLMSKLSQREQA
ncbi:hypothetical protein ADINL_0956 [Nitrincola lacisaponensis]|uniref:Uncharacterized protein n=1 Tax=Nitrincola lacisaponensis TaxID=267850 RepID=A0A063Y3U7_9GAMM|nr:hypothetical protein [Nitrincola lacisaponensis]KDE40364.1 hypothetical protein ADINL_0956 [Nitrincola lacisaponensis]